MQQARSLPGLGPRPSSRISSIAPNTSGAFSLRVEDGVSGQISEVADLEGGGPEALQLATRTQLSAQGLMERQRKDQMLAQARSAAANNYAGARLSQRMR